MRPQALQRYLTSRFRRPDARPAIILGPPGVGKTAVIQAAADAAGCEIIISHPAVEDPTDAKGMPWFVDGRAEFLPFGALRQACQATRPTVWFVDDLGQAPGAVQNAYMQLLLGRRCGPHALSPQTVMVAATNRIEDRAGVSRMGSALANRLAHLDIEVSLDDWQRWAIGAGVRPEVRAFLQFRPGLLHSFDPSRGDQPFPSPRSNAAVSDDLPHLHEEDLFEGVRALAGEGYAAEFCGFLRTYRDLPDLSALLASPDSVTLPSDPGVLYALVGALGERAKEAKQSALSAMFRIAGRMPAEYGVLLARDIVAVSRAALALPEAGRWLASHRDLLLGGDA